MVLVSENLARAEWGSASAALAKRLGPSSSGPWYEVVGVVKDVHHNGLSLEAPEVVVLPAVASETALFVVRSDRVGEVGFLEEVRRAVWSVSPNLSLAGVRTMSIRKGTGICCVHSVFIDLGSLRGFSQGGTLSSSSRRSVMSVFIS